MDQSTGLLEAAVLTNAVAYALANEQAVSAECVSRHINVLDYQLQPSYPTLRQLCPYMSQTQNSLFLFGHMFRLMAQKEEKSLSDVLAPHILKKFDQLLVLQNNPASLRFSYVQNAITECQRMITLQIWTRSSRNDDEEIQALFALEEVLQMIERLTNFPHYAQQIELRINSSIISQKSAELTVTSFGIQVPTSSTANVGTMLGSVMLTPTEQSPCPSVRSFLLPSPVLSQVGFPQNEIIPVQFPPFGGGPLPPNPLYNFVLPPHVLTSYEQNDVVGKADPVQHPMCHVGNNPIARPIVDGNRYRPRHRNESEEKQKDSLVVGFPTRKNVDDFVTTDEMKESIAKLLRSFRKMHNLPITFFQKITGIPNREVIVFFSDDNTKHVVDWENIRKYFVTVFIWVYRISRIENATEEVKLVGKTMTFTGIKLLKAPKSKKDEIKFAGDCACLEQVFDKLEEQEQYRNPLPTEVQAQLSDVFQNLTHGN